MEALWTNQDFGWFLVPKWPWIVAIGFFISKIRVIFLGMTVTFPPQSSYDVWFCSALSCWTYPHFHCYPLESPVLAAGKSWQTGFFHHFSIKSMDTSNSPSIYTKHFHLTTYHWMTNDKYLIRWANHGQSLHIYPHLRRHIYIYVEYIPIYNHCLSINWYRIIFCFFEHKILSILTTYHGSKLVKPWFFPAGNLRCEANELGEMHRAMSAPRGAKACHGCAGKVWFFMDILMIFMVISWLFCMIYCDSI
jgi:hypothetical protein